MIKEIRVSLVVRSSKYQIEEITRKFSRIPASAIRAGGRMSQRNSRSQVAQENVWSATLTESPNDDLSSVLRECIELIPSKLPTSFIDDADFTCDVVCMVVSSTDNQRIPLDPDVLIGLAERGVGLVVDIYCNSG